MKTISIKIEVEVSLDDIIGHLTAALEGGSNYWYYLPDLSMVQKHYKADDQPYLADKIIKAVCDHNEIVPVHDIEDQYEKIGEISLANIKRGLQLYAKIGRPFAADEADAEDGDVLFQLIALGDIVYG